MALLVLEKLDKKFEKLKKINEKGIDRERTISEALSALKENSLTDFFKKLNTILLKELDVDYSSFFFYSYSNLELYETNISSEEMRRDFETIKEYRDPLGQDFREGFEGKIVVIENSEKLNYPSAYHRSIRTVLFIPLSGVGFWVVEDNRKIGNDNLISAMAELSKQLEIIISLFRKNYLNSELDIYKLNYLIEELSEITKSVSVIKIENLEEICIKYGYSLKYEVLEVVINELKKEIAFRDGIGIDSDENYIWIFSMYESVEKILEKTKKRIEEMNSTIDEDTVLLKIVYETERYSEDAVFRVLSSIKMK